MKLFKNILVGSFLLSSFMMTGCDDFLEERPSKSSAVVPKTVEDLELILAGAYRNDEISHYLMFSSDDVKPNVDLYNGLNSLYPIQDIHAVTWEREVSAKNYKDDFWIYRYQNIFRSNMVLSILRDADASEAEKQRLKSQACFKRAYNNFLLVNLYALPYGSANLQEAGIPLKRSTSFDEAVGRSSIEETYKFIEEDIVEALKLDVALTDAIGFNSPNRVTTPAVYAFAARFYLAMHDYTNAQLYAGKALNEYGVDKIKDLNSFGYSSNSPEPRSITINGEVVDYELNYPATYQNWDPSFWTETYFSASVEADNNNWRFPSRELMDTYNLDGSQATDLRWKYFFVEHYSYRVGSTYDYPAYMFDTWTTHSGPSVPEMLLIKAECQARLGQWQDGLSTANILRAKRIDPAGVVDLSASSKDEAIKKIIEERRREMPITMRWYDLRRYNNNDYAGDDVLVNKTFFPYTDLDILGNEPVKTYTLDTKDRRYAAPIPNSEIISSNGVIEQNTY
ncbi:RagB/SusD family nutrient uptake outer membrane protein [Ancylomarina euxinus]|uniref:RagB/SusD family nutrient uptake outer membrane protein n=1 Tax=Ancylomarina euxinus TaxID=2283627 RepID=A0A425XY74_9BACT|nr:RagB/SusD family nutrient uptake outer membrane protein [Ancylomarina euxinus]MCZ4695954.1 RagB/SusD family nutrient uptake outer membrane protein [Ancylomarina euxinus]MUP16326.1 RagB/SusD family nutrient uptake outer membrane protein [Ancylomarina euxinus]RRG19722.1 RagB/SusD family nutrient uptake outer membrane protein [Ancylomarina euxinus]